jgi:hypothetical protein
MSARLGWTTVPLGAFFERDVARRMALPAVDAVLYVGILGKLPKPRGESSSSAGRTLRNGEFHQRRGTTHPKQ